jgi:hypothetical protein
MSRELVMGAADEENSCSVEHVVIEHTARVHSLQLAAILHVEWRWGSGTRNSSIIHRKTE